MLRVKVPSGMQYLQYENMMRKFLDRFISAKDVTHQPTSGDAAQTNQWRTMRSIEIHVDAVLDPRYVGVFREALQQKGLEANVAVTTVRSTFSPYLRSLFTRALLSAECRILALMGRGVPDQHRLPAADKRMRRSSGGESGRMADLLVHVQQPVDVVRPSFPSQRPFIAVTFPMAMGSDLAGLHEVCSQAEVSHLVMEVWRAGDLVPQVCDFKIKTMFTFAMTHDVIMRKAMHMVAECALRIDRNLPLPGSFAPLSVVAPNTQPMVDLAGVLLLLRYCGVMAYRMAGKAVGRLMGVRAQWQLQIGRTGWRQHGPLGLKTVPNPPGYYRADPFVVSHEGRTIVFAEEFSNASQLGHIMAMEVLPSGETVDLGRCIEEPFHLSFPYVFKWKEQWYMCPESSESRQIRVYRCLDFPLRWELDTVIQDGVAACDTVLFERDGLWWMLSNLDSSGTNTEFCSELHLFWADSPLSQDWHSHPLNPVICDGRSARNGGLLIEGDRIFRVAQAHAYGVYGKSHSVYEITTLTQTAYAETLAHRNQPPQDIVGSHHLSTNGEWTVSDSLRLIRSC